MVFTSAAVIGGIVFGVLGVGLLLLRALFACGWPDSNHEFYVFLRRIEDRRSSSATNPIFHRPKNSSFPVELIPGSSRDHIRIHSGGFRGPDYARRPVEGTRRVAVIGDSECFAALLPVFQTLPAVLETELGRRTKLNFQVMNFGVPGYNTAHEFRVLRDKALAYQPSVVILYYVFNDPDFRRLSLPCHSSQDAYADRRWNRDRGPA